MKHNADGRYLRSLALTLTLHKQLHASCVSTAICM